MEKGEKDLLKKIVFCHQGLLSPAELFNSLGGYKSDKIIHRLISNGYIEEVPTTRHDRNYTFYRASQKGQDVFSPIYIKVAHAIGGDIRTIIVSVIVSAITSLLSIYITSLFNK